MKTTAITLSILSWFVGLIIDANLDMGPNNIGVLNLRILFPILVMGCFILKLIEQNKNDDK